MFLPTAVRGVERYRYGKRCSDIAAMRLSSSASVASGNPRNNNAPCSNKRVSSSRRFPTTYPARSAVLLEDSITSGWRSPSCNRYRLTPLLTSDPPPLLFQQESHLF